MKRARRERRLVSLQFAEGLARMGAVCEAGASMTAEFVALKPEAAATVQL